MLGWRLRSLAEASSIEPIAEWRETLRLAPHLLPARTRPGRCSAGQRRRRRSGCRVPRGSETEARLDRGDRDPGAALAAQGKAEEAIPHLKRAVELEPHNARAHFRLGLALARSRTVTPVRSAHFNEAIHLQPDNVQCLWQTAWILATSPDPSFRDGSRAVRLATKAVELSGGQERACTRCAGRRAGRNRELPRGRRRSRASVDDGHGPQRRSIGRRH